jgi:NAD(P)-dependent dehydrogenase (short-subunit alcohol dehydrogenase family)
MVRSLEGKIAVVTGGTTGIGLATAKRFATEGAQVFVTGRRRAEIDAAVAAIGPKATGIQANSANLSDLNRLYDRVKAGAGRIDVLFVNAGGGSMLPLGSITEEQYDDTFGRNLHFGWVWRHQAIGVSLDKFPFVTRWYGEISARPAVVTAVTKTLALAQ